MSEPLPPDESRIKDLIALKRFEQPPPGHSELLASKIISRLEAEHLRARQPWYQRWSHAFSMNHLLTTAYSSVVMALLFVGWHYGEHFESDGTMHHFGNAGLRVGPTGLLEESDSFDPNKRLQSIFGTLDSLSGERSSSIQPVVHIPSIPIPGMPASMTIQGIDESSAY